MASGACWTSAGSYKNRSVQGQSRAAARRRGAS
ncbi:hypothetical protein [Acidovorax sp.]